MQTQPLLCYITGRAGFPGNETARRAALLDKIAEAARAGVDFVQLREKDLSSRQLENLAQAAAEIIRVNTPRSSRVPTKLLVNARADVALAIGAAGVHLPANGLAPAEVRAVWANAGKAGPVVSISCHTLEEVQAAAQAQADFALFAPVFEKKDLPGRPAAGLEALREACRASIPILALGGVTLTNASSCLEAGAAGIAAIRLFQENQIAGVLARLRP